MDHSYEELRDAVLDLLAGREKSTHDLNQYANLALGVAELFRRRERTDRERGRAIDRQEQLSPADRELFLEVFWGLFREGVITLGYNDCNRNFPFCRVSHFGRRLLEGGKAYFFYDVSSYTKVLLKEVPQLHDVTLLYLQEAMQSFRSGCMLAASVMLGVATEHTFLRLMDTIDENSAHSTTFASVKKKHSILHKVSTFMRVLNQNLKSLPSDVRENLDTQFGGILHVIRTFRNESGHPTGKIVDREQAYILLHLFISYAKTMYELIAHYSIHK